VQSFCGCEIEADNEPVQMRTAKAKPRQFRFQLVYGNYPGFAFKGFTNAQTVAMIRKAMVALSSVSGAKFVESSSKPSVRFYFINPIKYNAIGVYMGDGKVYLSQTRPVTEAVVHACVQHEVGHYFGIKANPAADKWGHCRVGTCIMNINGNGTAFCGGCRGQLVAKYGRA
jgi:hypothetical protein